ncbi:MAG: CHRD domain-containing protein [Myxococcales bacterium]|nr:CHRD domain-containing protein [Myxococcales bacterium]
MCRSIWIAGAVAALTVVALGCGPERPPPAPVTLEAALSGANEVPPVATSAQGDVSATLRGNQIELSGSFANLSSDLREVQGSPGHIHEAPPGENGPIVMNLEVTSPDRRSGSFGLSATLNDQQVAAFNAGRFYVNLHTADHPGGELRAQLTATPPRRVVFESSLSGASGVPPVATTASGTASVELVGNVLVLTGRFQALLTPLLDVGGTSVHVHQAPAGQNGPIVFNLEVLPSLDRKSGSFRLAISLTDEQRATLETGGYYVNVHTLGNPTGEIRAQLQPIQQL